MAQSPAKQNEMGLKGQHLNEVASNTRRKANVHPSAGSACVHPRGSKLDLRQDKRVANKLSWFLVIRNACSIWRFHPLIRTR